MLSIFNSKFMKGRQCTFFNTNQYIFHSFIIVINKYSPETLSYPALFYHTYYQYFDTQYEYIYARVLHI